MTIFQELTKFVTECPYASFGAFLILFGFANNFLCFRTKVTTYREDDDE